MEKLSVKITDLFLRRRLIDEDQREWCEYMLMHRLMDVEAFLVLVPIGALLCGFWASFGSFAVLRFLRARTSGYHAFTPRGCMFASLGVHLACMLVSYRQMALGNAFVISIPSVIAIMLLGPVSDENYRPTQAEKRFLQPRIFARCLLCVVLSCSIAFVDTVTATAMASAILMEAILLYIPHRVKQF